MMIDYKRRLATRFRLIRLERQRLCFSRKAGESHEIHILNPHEIGQTIIGQNINLVGWPDRTFFPNEHSARLSFGDAMSF